MDKLRLALIGVGLGGRIHINSIKRSRDAMICGFVAPARDANNDFADSENIPLFDSLEDCIREQKPDGVIIASPNAFHLEHASICIDAGLPVLLEKPITASLSEGLKLMNLTERTNAKVLVGHHRAHNPILKAVRDLISQGRIGRIVTVSGSAQFHKPSSYFDQGPWRKFSGGGPILINLVHEIDNIRRLVGEIVAVQAITSNSVRKFVVEDTAVINFIFENGALGSMVLSDTAASAKSWELTTAENPGYPSYESEDCYHIAGTLGSIGIPTMKLKFYPKSVKPSWWTPFVEETVEVMKADPIDIQLNHFLEVIKGPQYPLVTVRDGYRNLLVIDAIRKSAKTKSLVELGF